MLSYNRYVALSPGWHFFFYPETALIMHVKRTNKYFLNSQFKFTQKHPQTCKTGFKVLNSQWSKKPC